MSRTLIYYMPEYCEVAEKLRDNYIEHKHKEVDIISETEQDVLFLNPVYSRRG